jgi:hypothetical protein
MIAGKSRESKRLMALLSMIRSVTGYVKEQNSFRAFPRQRDSSECGFLQLLDYVDYVFSARMQPLAQK